MIEPIQVGALEGKRIDSLEERMLNSGLPVVELPVRHDFTPGLYRRTIFMPAGTLLTSKIHKTKHPYVVTQGVVSVYIPGVGVERIEAPHHGITMPDTRRVLYIHEDCVWATYHPLVDGEACEEDLPKIEARIIERRELPDGSTAFDQYQGLLEEARRALGLPEVEDGVAE